MSDTESSEPADPDEVLHHVTVADVETLHAMILTEDQAEQVKGRLAQALTAAINELRVVPGTAVTDEEMAAALAEVDNAVEGFSTDDEIEALNSALAAALSRWPGVTWGE